MGAHIRGRQNIRARQMRSSCLVPPQHPDVVRDSQMGGREELAAHAAAPRRIARPLNPVVDHSVVGRPRVADHDPVALAAGSAGQRVLDQVVRDRDVPAELVVITAPLGQRTRRRS